MRNFIILLFNLFLFQAVSPQGILVNPEGDSNSGLSPLNLINEVFVPSSSCAPPVTNFQLKENPGSSFPHPDRSWGYFRNEPGFPTFRGVLLTNGKAENAEGPSIEYPFNSFGEANWEGDSDAETIIGDTSLNATVFKFDFIPPGKNMSFTYRVGTSEFPESMQNDVVAIILSGPGINNDLGLSGKNIAKLGNLPFTVNNLVNNSTFISGPFQDIGYSGVSKNQFVSYESLIPYQTYTIKFIIADGGNERNDSGLFLLRNTFIYDLVLVNSANKRLGSTVNVCNTNNYPLTVNTDENDTNITYQWYHRESDETGAFTLIPGATGRTYMANSDDWGSGTYQVKVNNVQFCGSKTISTKVNFGQTPNINTSFPTQFVCSETSSHIFNLTELEPQITTEPGINFDYYYEINSSTVPVPDPTNFEVTGTVRVQIRVSYEGEACTRNFWVYFHVGLPSIETTPYEARICNTDGNNATFNLSDYKDNITSEGTNNTGVIFEFYLDEEMNNLIADTENFQNTSNPQTVFVKLYYPEEPACFSVTPLDLSVGLFPETKPGVIDICDTMNDGVETVDLTQSSVIENSEIPVSISYWTESNMQILDPENFIVDSEYTTVYALVENEGEDCSTYEPILIHLLEAPILFDSQDYVLLCDTNNNGIEIFDLTDVGNQMFGGQNNVEIRYYTAYNDADSGNDNFITDPTAFENTSNPQTIWVRLEKDSGCFVIGSFELEVKGYTEIDYQIDDLDKCAQNELIIGVIFDLTENEDSILNGISPEQVTIEYYPDFNSFMNNENLITNPEAYSNISSPQEIWVKLIDIDGCVEFGSFDINVTEIMTLPYSIENIELCSQTSETTQVIFDLTENEDNILDGGNPEQFIIQYFTEFESAINNINPILNPENYANLSSPQTIWVRVTDDEDCSKLGSFEIEALPITEVDYMVPNLEICAQNEDVIGVPFDLTENEDSILNGNNPQTHVINYYADFEDAINNVNPIINPENYANISSPQEIWFRISNEENCSEYGSFEIIVFSLSEINYDIPELINCSLSDSVTGVIFDLTENENAILNGNNPNTHTIQYYLDVNSAINDVNPIANPENYPNISSPQEIWFRISDEENCVKYGSFEIIVSSISEINYDIPELINCAQSDSVTGVIFDLTENENAILNGNNPNIYTVQYYLDMDSAINGVNPIVNPENYPNISSPQTIWVRLFSPDDCVKYGSFEIEVSEINYLLHEIPELTFCSVTGNLTGNITNLTENENAILNGANPDLYEITYYLTENEALNNINPIANPDTYPNISSPQEIWVRVTDLEGCNSLGSFILNYNLAPIANDAHLSNCGFENSVEFYLPDLNELMVTNSAGLTFSYYLSFDDAENMENPIPDNFIAPYSGYQVFVRVDNESECFTIVTGELIIDSNMAVLPNTYYECDSPWEISDGIALFDLTSMNVEIKEQLNLFNSEITYYITMEEAIHGINPIQNPQEYQNLTNPQIIYAFADDLHDNCGGIAEFTLQVLPVPDLELEDEISICLNYGNSFEINDDFDTYTWYDSEGNVIGNQNIVVFNEEGTYILGVTQAGFNCPAKREIKVNLDESPIITNINTDGNSAYFYAAGGSPPYKFSYDNGLTWISWNSVHGLEGGIYELVVKGEGGCISDAKTFAILGIPNVITPNGDGINDFWDIRGLEFYSDIHLKIFDRFGKVYVDRKVSPDFKWDARYSGKNLPTGDYWYIMTIDNLPMIKGHISIIN